MTASAKTSFRFRCLGAVELTSADGGAIRMRTRKQLAMLLVLAWQNGRGVARDAMIELLWSVDAEKKARHSLSSRRAWSYRIAQFSLQDSLE